MAATTATVFEMPDDLKGKSAEEIAQLYLSTRTEHEKYKGEWEPRAKELERWSSLGKPDEIEEVVKWGKTIAAPLVNKIAKGEAYLLNDADYKAYKAWADKTGNGTRQPAADNAAPDDELFAPIRKSLGEELRGEVTKLIEERAKGFDTNIRTMFKQIQDQLNLYGHVSKLQRQHPNLDFEGLLKEGAELTQMPADQLLEKLIQNNLKMATMDEEVEKRVAAKLAEHETSKNTDAVKALLENRAVGAGTMFGAQKPNRESVTRGLVGMLNDKFPGLLAQMPLT